MTKAQSLERLAGNLNQFRIPTNCWFYVDTWKANSVAIIKEICKSFGKKNVLDGSICLAVRSSASDEDGTNYARAGEYNSVLNVPADDPVAICKAVESVIESYHRKGDRTGNDELIIQEMVQDTIMSGVVFTHDLNSGAPYYVINYDDVSGFTNTVTAGHGEYSNRTIYIHRNAIESLRSERFQKLLRAIVELEEVMQSRFLDIEFAIAGDLTPYLLQVRAITTRPNWNRAVAKRIDAALQGIQAFVKQRFQPQAGVFGNSTVFGQMPDWNPAEMIGRAPRGLAFSLYKTLITDHAWRLARETMGYAVPAGRPLMVSLAGQPFIDTRLSFHSYLPAKLEPAICEKLVNTWVNRLKEHPHLHDKVEFDVAITTYSFDIDDKIKAQTGGVLNDQEIISFKEALRHQTIELVSGRHPGEIGLALNRVEELREKQSCQTSVPSNPDINNMSAIVEDCIRLGTIPFSILARHGFIARTLLLSLAKRGILTLQEVQQIQTSIRTIASDLVVDMCRLQTGEMPREEFMQNYGHLRPGTYDILSLRYDQMPNLGLSDVQIRPVHGKEYIINEDQRKKIDELLETEGFTGIDTDKLLEYIKRATAGREYGKFVFTRSISNLLEMIANFGEFHGLSRDELSYIPFNNLLDIVNSSSEGSIEDRLRLHVEEQVEKHAITAAIRLPQVLFDEAGVHIIPFQVSQPNFITSKKVTADSVRLLSKQTPQVLSGKIVLIENADPGFDWIFSQPIAGLITKYGGANSHMAIRCAEFGIPAAIGCGEQRFEILNQVERIMLDCSTSLIQHLH